MQIAFIEDNLHECKLPSLKTICMKCQILFSGKSKKTTAENFTQSAKL